MPLGDDLRNGYIAQIDGTLYMVGVDGGQLYIERSDDKGTTKATWNDGTTRRLIAAVKHNQIRASMELYNTNEIQVAVPQNGRELIYVSRDAGETWTLQGTVP